MTDRAALIAEADKWMAERGPGWSAFGLIARLRDALSSSPRAAGWKMVPVEPTEAMLAKIREHYAPHFPPDDPHGFRESWVTEAARHYRDMLAAAPSPPATAGVRGWKPIKSAPRDGTFVLLTGATRHDGKPYIEVGYCIPDSHYWMTAQAGLNKPTHWQPLPAPPASNGEKP